MGGLAERGNADANGVSARWPKLTESKLPISNGSFGRSTRFENCERRRTSDDQAVLEK